MPGLCLGGTLLTRSAGQQLNRRSVHAKWQHHAGRAPAWPGCLGIQVGRARRRWQAQARLWIPFIAGATLLIELFGGMAIQSHRDSDPPIAPTSSAVKRGSDSRAPDEWETSSESQQATSCRWQRQSRCGARTIGLPIYSARLGVQIVESHAKRPTTVMVNNWRFPATAPSLASDMWAVEGAQPVCAK